MFEFSLRRRFPNCYVARFEVGMRGWVEVRDSAFEAVIGAVYNWVMA